jgi:hypothetical protein
MDGPSDLCFGFDIGKQQVDTQGDPELGHDRIFGGTKGGFELQIQLDLLNLFFLYL